MFKYFYGAMALALFLVSQVHPQVATLAFPGAEGFGRFAKGGRGGVVMEVTNLNDSGAGSLRACTQASGPRTCVFRVGGTISLTSEIVIKNPFLTIAGQTAPGGGIAIKDRGIAIRASDVIIRYIRVRPGTASLPSNNNGIYVQYPESGGTTRNVIIDHCSISWGTDDLTGVWGWGGNSVNGVTYQWNIISEGLSCNNTTTIILVPGCGSRGFLITKDLATNISVHHNYFAHVAQRHPATSGGDLDFVNNVSYNAGAIPTGIYPDCAPVRVNIVGNYYKKGIDIVAGETQDIEMDGGRPFSSTSDAHVQGNIGSLRPNNTYPETANISQDNGGLPLVSRHNFPLVTTTDVFIARDQVLAGAGATLPARDSVDQRVVNDFTNGIGRIIGYPSDVGGWPTLAAGTPPADTDRDGMPDSWETQYGFNPNSAADGPQDADGDGYTNLEEYLNRTNAKGAGPLAAPSNLRIVSP